MPSRRERIKELLKDTKSPLIAEDIVTALGEPTDLETIYDDIGHIAKSVYGESKGTERVVMIPPTCRSCGFIFKGLRRPKRPSRCPKCKSERLTSPMFRIVSK